MSASIHRKLAAYRKAAETGLAVSPIAPELADEPVPTADFAVRETPDALILTPRPRVATNRHGRYDISTARGQAQARHFMLTCTDPDASIHFTCPGGDIAAAMREVIGEQATPAEPETVAIQHRDPHRWHQAIGLTLAALGGAAAWWGVLILLGVAR